MNLSDFDTKNTQSLDYLLKQMYMLGYKKRTPSNEELPTST